MYTTIAPFKRFLPALLLLIPAFAKARPKADTIRTNQGVEVFVKNNQSRKLKLIIEAHLADLDSGLLDYGRVGTGANADFIFRKYLSLHAGYSTTYYSFLQHQSSDVSFTKNVLKGFSVGDAGVRIHILDGKGWAKRKMNLQSFKEMDENGRPRTTVRFLKARFPCRRIVALRGGYFMSNAPISADHNGDISKVLDQSVRGSVTAIDGTVMKGDYFTNSYTTGFYAGITKIINMKIRTSSTIEWLEGKEMLTALFKENYADIIFGTTTIDPFLVGSKQHTVGLNTPGGFSVDNIGWRIGGRLLNTDKSVNAGVNYEVGSRPGIRNRSVYLHIGVTIALMK